MPTENRSSNTEMVSVPRALAERISNICMFSMYKEDWRALSEILAQPAQHQGEPVATVSMVDPLVLTTGGLHALKVGDKLYTHPAPADQQEPVAYRQRFICPEEGPSSWVLTESSILAGRPGWEVLPLYTHADPGEVERLREEAGGLEQVVKLQVEALKGLIFAARTTGGTAGPDQGLIQACEKAEHAISLGGIGKAYMSGADEALSASAEPEMKP